MNNHTQIGFLSILFILVLFFVLHLNGDRESVIEVSSGHIEDCPGYCRKSKICIEESIYIVRNDLVRRKGALLSPEKLISTLYNDRCKVETIYISAAPSIDYRASLALTNELMRVFPSAKITWRGGDA